MPSLSQTPLPNLLVGFARDGFTGALRLRTGKTLKTLQWHAGTLVSATSSDPADGFLRILTDAGTISEADLATIEDCMRTKGWDALRATAALKKATPRDLVQALARQIEQTAGSALAWTEGDYEMDFQPPEGSPPALPITVTAILYRGIAKHWPVDRALAALGDRSTHYPHPSSDFSAHLSTLHAGDAGEAFETALDGVTTAFALCQASPRPETWAALVVLDLLGGLRWEADPGTEEPVEATADAPMIEIQISGGAPEATATADPQARSAMRDDIDDRAAALRDEILTLHGRLKEIDHYELLGLDRDANHAKVKRAYLKAAKRLHPDRATHLGLEEVKDAANDVFAQITRAHGILSDVEQRRSYDASLEGHTEVDADRVAQAEVFYRKGEALLRAGNFLDAVDLLDAAVQVWPDEADYQAALAWALHRKNPPDNDAALAHFERALELGAAGAQTHLRMSLVVKEMGDLPRAGVLAQKARSIDADVKP